MNREQTKADFEARRDQFSDEVVAFIKHELTKLCDRKGWDFEALHYTQFVKRRTNVEVDTKEAKAGLALVFWCRDVTGSDFPDSFYRSGEWTGV